MVHPTRVQSSHPLKFEKFVASRKFCGWDPFFDKPPTIEILGFLLFLNINLEETVNPDDSNDPLSHLRGGVYTCGPPYGFLAFCRIENQNLMFSWSQKIAGAQKYFTGEVSGNDDVHGILTLTAYNNKISV